MFFSNFGVPLWDHLASSLNLPRRPNLFKVSKQFSVKFNKLKTIGKMSTMQVARYRRMNKAAT